ncbi:gamma-glutamyltransferase [Comamonas composti]|uniref:gamma-glutamyltransferase n=1 Tax=Comamonas composti TaxID=408558 RepID=UPI00040CD8D3|nr:gamma-glutamyltransferase [Comamonas composti]
MASPFSWPRCWLGASLAAPLLLSSCVVEISSDDRDDVQACAITTDDGSVVVGSGLPGDPAAPEPSSGYRVGKKAVHAAKYMVVTANPLASKAGCEVLKSGGSAVDAAVAVQMVLGLVEPQSSGIGGGAFMLYRDAASGKVLAYDGRETAPAAATENYLRYVDDGSNHNPPQPSARASGRSIGTPGVLRMLEMAHKDYGRTRWGQLFQPGIDLASQGFVVSGRMAAALEGAKDDLRRDADAVQVFFNPQGQPWPLGSRFVNQSYADTLRSIASGGADAFYRGDLARAMVDKIGVSQSMADGSAITPGKTTVQDLANYQAKRREAICTSYRARYVICSMPPPSSGGIAVSQAMGILENFNLEPYRPTAIDGEGGKPSVMGVHLVSEALRLAYADRDKYVADTDFVPLPGGSPSLLLDKSYLRQRAGLISSSRSMGTAQAGSFGLPALGVVPVKEAGTTHVSIVDAKGNALSMTTTVESSMGSFHVTRGFVLNNQLTDFSAEPRTAEGPVANRLQPGKRPRSSMAPTLVFDMQADGSAGSFKMATGSPGGGTIIQYVTKTLVGALDWGLDAQQATSLVDFGATNSPVTNVGGEHPNINATDNGSQDPLVKGLRAMGHEVSVNAQSSGIGTILNVRRNNRQQLEGGADPRREGLALGDAVR